MTPHVTYIKLSPYLAKYWRKVMKLKPDAPLELTALESRMYFLPFLKENAELYRFPYTNDKGYFKDANSYCEFAYKLARKSDTGAAPPKDKKIPTLAECAKLTPILLPPRAFVNRKNKYNQTVREEIPTNSFFELKDSGVTAIRNYIHDYFYAELHTYVLAEQRRCYRLGKTCKVYTTIEYFLINNGILEDDDDINICKKMVKDQLYQYDNKYYKSCDPDSIRRSYSVEIHKKHLTSNQQYSQKNN